MKLCIDCHIYRWNHIYKQEKIHFSYCIYQQIRDPVELHHNKHPLHVHVWRRRNTSHHHLFIKLSSLFIQQDQNIQPSSLFNILNFLLPYPVHSLTRQILWCITLSIHFISDVCFDINMPIRISSHRNHSAPTYKPIVDTYVIIEVKGCGSWSCGKRVVILLLLYELLVWLMYVMCTWFSVRLLNIWWSVLFLDKVTIKCKNKVCLISVVASERFFTIVICSKQKNFDLILYDVTNDWWNNGSGIGIVRTSGEKGERYWCKLNRKELFVSNSRELSNN